MKRMIGLLLLTSSLALTGQAWAEVTNHCDNPRSWADWDARAAKHPDDQALQTLHALCMGLCFKVAVAKSPLMKQSLFLKTLAIR
jgi:hypothetical protein